MLYIIANNSPKHNVGLSLWFFVAAFGFCDGNQFAGVSRFQWILKEGMVFWYFSAGFLRMTEQLRHSNYSEQLAQWISAPDLLRVSKKAWKLYLRGKWMGSSFKFLGLLCKDGIKFIKLWVQSFAGLSSETTASYVDYNLTLSTFI